MSATRHFNSPLELKTALTDQQYIATDEIGIIMYLSQELGKPLLTEKRSCVGKTELTKAIAAIIGCELIYMQCDVGLDETMAIYQ